MLGVEPYVQESMIDGIDNVPLEQALREADLTVITLQHRLFRENKASIAAVPHYDCVGLLPPGMITLHVLIENTARPGFTPQHGLSLHITTPRHRLLFDAGQNGLFISHAGKMGLSLSQVDAMILSHGHFDHGGGNRRFLRRQPAGLSLRRAGGLRPPLRPRGGTGRWSPSAWSRRWGGTGGCSLPGRGKSWMRS